MQRFYPIGTPGTPWGDDERRAWFDAQTIERSYQDDVRSRIDALATDEIFDVSTYGALPIDPERYPLFSVTMRSTDPSAPWVLITGGVHGYETSGVHGALAFLETSAASNRHRVNLLVAPCVSPWGYEVINRWNPNAVDPNRSFSRAHGVDPASLTSPSEEALAVMLLVAAHDVDWLMHIDLHETTDTDESEFRPALAARDGKAFDPCEIPDGFYTVDDSDNPQPEFQAAIISAVEAVTHIAPPDDHGQIIGEDATQHGVIDYPLAEWGLCPSMTIADFTTTTEVYPDSPHATDVICNDAQIAAVRAALDFVL